MATFASSVLTYFAFGYSSLKAYRLCLAVLDGHYSAVGLLAYYLIVSTLFLRRSKAKLETQDPWDWSCAILATWLPVHFNAAEPLTGGIFHAALLMQFIGTVGMLLAISELSTSFGIVPANRGVKTRGLYQFVRHPLYFAELLTIFGFVLLNYTVTNATLFVILVLLQAQRIVNEERLLKQDAEYARYAEQVQHRLVPYVF